MNRIFNSRAFRVAMIAGAFVCVLVAPILRAQQQAPPAQGGRGGPQQPAAPTGPMAPEKFKDIQLLKDVPAAELGNAMRYFVASTGIQCSGCHQTDRATGEVNYAADSNGKRTGREMIKIVQVFNAGDFGIKINCATCHQGRNQPAGLQPATLMTADQILAFNSQQASAALRAMSPPPDRAAGPGGDRAAGPGGGAPPAQGQQGPTRGQAPPAGAPGQPQPGGGRGQQPGPPVDDILKKYADALGSAAAMLQSRVMIGTVTTRAAQAMPFSITQKGKMYLEAVQAQPAPRTLGYDGTTGWEKVGDKIEELGGFSLDSALRGADMMLASEIKAKYPTWTSAQPQQLALTPGAAPTTVNILRGTFGQGTNQIIDQFYFDATTGLLVRRTTRTATPLNGALTETTDYANYRAEGGVMMPHKITRTNWNTLDTLTVSRVVVNGTVDDASFRKPK